MFDGVVSRSGSLVENALREHLPHGASCVICDVPVHDNWGDALIHIGTRAALERSGHRIVAEFDRGLAASRLPNVGHDAVVLIPGGGNFGDLYPPHQRHREWILRTCRDVPVVQLPQSIHFEDRSALDRAKRAVGNHPRFTLLVRDAPSLDFAAQHFDVPSYLVPDFAFGMGLQARPTRPNVDVLWLARQDSETQERPRVDGHPAVVRGDWSSRDLGLVWCLGAWPTWVDRNLRRVEHRIPGAGSCARRLRAHTVPRQVRPRAEMAKRWLSRGRVVITDRLHGHILCLLLGLPHVLLDNSIGKLSAYFETWTPSMAGVTFASDEQTAQSCALALVTR